MPVVTLNGFKQTLLADLVSSFYDGQWFDGQMSVLLGCSGNLAGEAATGKLFVLRETCSLLQKHMRILH